MSKFMKWLRVEMLRLRSFDWGPGSRRIHRLKDGVIKFSSAYSTNQLTTQLGLSETDMLEVADSETVHRELGEKSFTLAWKEGSLTLSWLEEGISEWKTECDQHYFEEDGKYFSTFRMRDKVIYLDGTERVVGDTGDPPRVPITKERFDQELERIRRKE